MLYLLIVSIIWAFSFGIIKDNLTGLDSNFVAFARMVISLLIFLPLLRFQKLKLKSTIQLVLIGMVQYGLMYVTYILSYQYLQAYQVALFTIFTPIYVTLINDILEKKFHSLFFGSAILSVAGTAIIVYTNIKQIELQLGFLFMQISNLSFAFGQVYYKKLMKRIPEKTDVSIYGLLYLGAVLFTGLFTLLTTDYPNLTLSTNQIYSLLYLGVIASGICFFLWNFGARKTDTGTLSVFNNIKIPLAIFVSLIFFSESADITRLLIGGAVILGALVLSQKLAEKNSI